MSDYMSLVPRGLENVVDDILDQEIAQKYDMHAVRLGDNSARDKDIVEKVSSKVVEQARKKLSKQKGGAFRRQSEEKDTWHPCGSAMMNASFASTCLDMLKSVNCTSQLNLSVGYATRQKQVWTTAGQLPGTTWYHMSTNAPESVVASLRCFGPLVALVASTTACSERQLRTGPSHSMIEAVKDVQSLILSSDCYEKQFSKSLALWKQHVQEVWMKKFEHEPGMIDRIRGMERRISSGSIKYRLSCIRTAASGKRKRGDSTPRYSYSREEFLKKLLELEIVPAQFQSRWEVDLTNYDLEVVIFIDESIRAAIGLTLRPYNLVDAKSFHSGNLPPDITEPYLGKKYLHDLLRLRPTTAHLLLHMAQIEHGEVVLDPCAGIGTIPIEASCLLKQKRCIGLGGDVSLCDPVPTISDAAVRLEQMYQSLGRDILPPAFSHRLVAWDATLLPLRNASIDVITSDLPFGQSCLSSAELPNFLELFFFEMARVLLPNRSKRSRMVLLCGSNEGAVLKALSLSQRYWVRPYSAVLPVNISGIPAWVFKIERNDLPFTHTPPRHRQRVAKMAAKRELAASRRRSDQHAATTNMKAKQRRVQA